MNRFILNIGRKVEGRKRLLPRYQITKALEASFFVLHSIHEYSPEGGEPTLVIECSRPSHHQLFDALELVSDSLYQDCVALWNGTSGALVGPRADKWGPFNAEYFILPNGNTLESTLQ